MKKYISLLLMGASMIGASLQLTGYWGQQSADAEKNLAAYCQNYDIIVIGFLSGFGVGPTTLNLANHCDTPNSSPGCPQVASDIATCQSMGKKILLSMGGAAGYYGFSNDQMGSSYAQTVWDMFLGGSASFRPFGSVKLDGIDLDPEGVASTGFGAFAVQLRSLFANDASKTYYLSAAPQCPYPDATLGPNPGTALSMAHFDFIWVQFYNNGHDPATSGACDIGDSYYITRRDQWANYAQSANTKLFIGVPSASGSRFQSNGYVPVSTLNQAVQDAYTAFPNTVGGVMLWDVSGEEINPGYASAVKANLNAISGGSNPTTQTSTSSSTSTSTSTSTSGSSVTPSSTSSSTSGCSQPSGSPASGACPTNGYMTCYGSNYQTCSNGQWGPVQQCGAGTGCSQSGNYIYCVSSPCPTQTSTSVATTTSSGGDPTCSTDGQMRCSGTSTYQTCTHGMWSANQSCQSGLRCSASGQYVYCTN